MSLSEILDEIRDNVDDIDPGVVNPEDDTLASEEIRGITISTAKATVGFKVSNFDTGTVDKFNNFYRRCSLHKTTKELIKVDRSLAQEALATLPMYSKTDEAKFTSYPSSANKKLLDEIVFTEEPKTSDEVENVIRNMLTEVNDGIEKAQVAYDETVLGIGTIKDLIKTKFGVVNPTIISNSKSLGLLTSKLSEMTYIDDTALDYDKYSGTLKKKICGVAYSPKLSEFREFLEAHCGSTVMLDPCFFGIVAELDRTEVILKASFGSISTFRESATVYFERNDKELSGWVSDLVNSMPHVVKSSDAFNKTISCLHGEDGLIAILIDFLEFID